MASPASRARARSLITWLFSVAFLVFAMVVVGGITRLTESGLSITEWKPVTGALPPLNERDWLAAFEAYKLVPQYEAIHATMTLAQFKFIFFWEWVHRLLGRVIGLAFALPLLWFWLRGAIPTGYKGRLLALLALGGLQGAVGWWMVKSGLWQGVAVSHYRLSVHLLLALFILAGLVWTALDLKQLERDPAAHPSRMTPATLTVAVVLFVQLLFGAWVAGMDAGKVTQSWPMMGSGFLPVGIDWSGGLWATFTADPYLVHFIHRWWAFVAFIAIGGMAGAVKRKGARRASIAIHSALGIQVLLGIATVMTGVNIVLAVSHQAVGALLVAATTWGAHAFGRRRR
ncbi:MAG: COX15/CtaA family protein [Sphingomonadales bacterium]